MNETNKHIMDSLASVVKENTEKDTAQVKMRGSKTPPRGYEPQRGVDEKLKVSFEEELEKSKEKVSRGTHHPFFNEAKNAASLLPPDEEDSANEETSKEDTKEENLIFETPEEPNEPDEEKTPSKDDEASDNMTDSKELKNSSTVDESLVKEVETEEPSDEESDTKRFETEESDTESLDSVVSEEGDEDVGDEKDFNTDTLSGEVLADAGVDNLKYGDFYDYESRLKHFLKEWVMASDEVDKASAYGQFLTYLSDLYADKKETYLVKDAHSIMDTGVLDTAFVNTSKLNNSHVEIEDSRDVDAVGPSDEEGGFPLDFLDFEKEGHDEDEEHFEGDEDDEPSEDDEDGELSEDDEGGELSEDDEGEEVSDEPPLEKATIFHVPILSEDGEFSVYADYYDLIETALKGGRQDFRSFTETYDLDKGIPETDEEKHIVVDAFLRNVFLKAQEPKEVMEMLLYPLTIDGKLSDAETMFPSFKYNKILDIKRQVLFGVFDIIKSNEDTGYEEVLWYLEEIKKAIGIDISSLATRYQNFEEYMILLGNMVFYPSLLDEKVGMKAFFDALCDKEVGVKPYNLAYYLSEKDYGAEGILNQNNEKYKLDRDIYTLMIEEDNEGNYKFFRDNVRDFFTSEGSSIKVSEVVYQKIKLFEAMVNYSLEKGMFDTKSRDALRTYTQGLLDGFDLLEETESNESYDKKLPLVIKFRDLCLDLLRDYVNIYQEEEDILESVEKLRDFIQPTIVEMVDMRDNYSKLFNGIQFDELKGIITEDRNLDFTRHDFFNEPTNHQL